MSSSLDRVNSRYTQGGKTESLSNRLGFWDRRVFPTDITDKVEVLEAKYHRKPWLFAYDKYKDVQLMWFILQYNTILDIDEEFITGASIRYPTIFRLRVGLLSRG